MPATVRPCRFLDLPLPFLDPSTAVSLTFHCRFLDPSTAFSPPCLDLPLPFLVLSLLTPAARSPRAPGLC